MKGVIILGSPRSGTTLLRRLINGHQDICCPGETFLFRGAAEFLKQDHISGRFDYGVVSGLEGLGYEAENIYERMRVFVRSFYEELAIKAGKGIWAAKTAIDVFYLEEIEALFSGHVKFITVQRHGLDVVCSMDELSRDIGVYIKELHEYIKQYPSPMEAYCHAWADVSEKLLQFQERQGDDCYSLKYEDLISDPDKMLESLTEFLEVEPYKLCSADILSKDNVNGMGDWKSYKKNVVDQTSQSRWQREISESQVQTLAPIVNQMLHAYGYDGLQLENEEERARRIEISRMMMRSET